MEYIRNNLKRKPIEVMDLIEKVLEIIPNCRNINTLKISCLLNMQREKEVLDIFERIYPRVFTQPCNILDKISLSRITAISRLDYTI